jgi:hypothetical protein
MGPGSVKMGMFEVRCQVPEGTDPMLGSHLLVRQLLECSFNRFMLQARTCSAISVLCLSVFIWNCVDPIQDFIVPNGCSTF